MDMRRAVLLMASVTLAVVLASGAALAQTTIPPDLVIGYLSVPDKVQPGSTSNFFEVSLENRGGSTATIPSGTVVMREEIDGGSFGSSCGASTGYSCRRTEDGKIEIVSQVDNTIPVGTTRYVWGYISAPSVVGKMEYSAMVDPDGILQETNETNNTRTKTVYVGDPPPTDVSVTQIDLDDPLQLGNTSYYKIEVTNNGPDTAFNVQLQDDLPENTTFRYAYGYDSCNHLPEYGAVICPMGNLVSGQSRTMELAVRPTAVGTISNTVTAVSDYGDTDASNNTAVEDTLVQDTRRPTGEVSINGGRASTSSRSVNLKLNARDPSPGTGVAEMRFRNGNADSWSAWQTYATSKAWRLSRGAGKKTVLVQYRDGAGNISRKADDSITYRP